MVSAQAGPGYDFFGGGFQGGSPQVGAQNGRDFRNEMRVEPVFNSQGRTVPRVRSVTIVIHNLSGGFNRVWGVAREPSPAAPYSDLGRAVISALDSRSPGTLCLPLKMNLHSASVSTPTAALFAVNAFSGFAVGTGGVANNALWKETSGTDPTLTAITYSPGSAITNLSKIHIAGAGEYVAVCKAGGVVEVLSDFTAAGPTVVGSMHANTNPCWGIIESPLNSTTPGASTLLIYAGTSIYTLGTESAIGTAPTAALTNVPGGGRPLGIIQATGTPARAYWQIPRTNLAASMFTTLGATPCEIWSTTLEGTDRQVLKLPIANVFYAEVLDNTIIYSDGVSVKQWDGTAGSKDLGWVTQRSQSSDRTWRIGGLCNANGVLRVITMNKGNGSSITTSWNIEEYEPSDGTWHNRSIGVSETGSGLGSATGSQQLGLLFTAGPGQGYSEVTGYQHVLRCGGGALNFTRQFVPPYGTSIFHIYNQRAGAGASTGQVFETGGVVSGGQTTNLQSPVFILEGFEGKPFVLEEIGFYGDLGLANTSALGAQWRLDIAEERGNYFGVDWTADSLLFAQFDDSGLQRGYVKRFDGNSVWMSRLAFKVSLTQGSNTYQTPNGVPFTIKLLVFDRVEDVRSPRDIRRAA